MGRKLEPIDLFFAAKNHLNADRDCGKCPLQAAKDCNTLLVKNLLEIIPNTEVYFNLRHSLKLCIGDITDCWSCSHYKDPDCVQTLLAKLDKFISDMYGGPRVLEKSFSNFLEATEVFFERELNRNQRVLLELAYLEIEKG